MTLLLLGLIIWYAAHLFKRVAPGIREPMGEKGKGPIALLILVSVVLMVTGFRAADAGVYWGRTPALAGINNLLVLFGFYMFAVSGMKTRLARVIRHPQLTGVKAWAVGHLLVNGEVESIVLFGGLLAWAVIEVIVINRAQPAWTKPDPAPMKKEVIAIVASVLLFGVVAMIHAWLGYNPFG
ncbi:MAG: hypothetical protein CSA70_10945 [Rhodobacterales bacterium]|nr:MAG: hypothetical protein CSA70_10945 [Rhodobacterales bacterium]